MEVMEEGNLMDRVPILLQRDFNYYESNQTVLQERICSGVVGGKLDFPRNASFASVKLVMWWEEEFVAAFRKSSGLLNGDSTDEEFAAGCGGVVKASDPDKFVSLVVKSSELLLEHLHILSQEALDHADLPVLTATLGAAALIKNSLHCFVQVSQYTDGGQRTGSLQAVQKKYSEMAEALAERVLDLHGRLLSLYVLQGESGNGGSPCVRMWWLYMQGTKQDLWDTVPPKMAQRVFAGMLNETLTILTVRYTQETSRDKNNIMMNDILNILICVTQLLPAICTKGEELLGVELTSLGKIIRDVHSKCHELLVCLLLRGTPLHYLYKIFKQPTGVHLFDVRPGYPSLWYILSMPHLFPPHSPDKTVLSCKELSTNTALALELYVYLAQPQPLWPLLLKVLLMRDCYVSSMLLKRCMELLPKDGQYLINKKPEAVSCEGFLCSKDGSCSSDRKVTFANAGSSSNTSSNEPSAKLYSDVVLALTHIVLAVGSAADMKKAIIHGLESMGTNWASSLDRRQLWVLKHPPWLTAILSIAKPILPPIAQTLISAVQTGASMYQAMSLCLTCFSQLWDCVPQSLFTISKLISHVLPATSTPVGESVLLQFLIMAIYEELINIAEVSAAKELKAFTPEPAQLNPKDNKRKPSKKENKTKKKEKNTSFARTDMVYSVSFDGSLSSVSSVAMCLAEALCSIDEDNKHTDQIQKFLQQTQKPIHNDEDFSLEGISELLEACYPRNPVIESVEVAEGSEVMVSQLLMTSVGKNSLQVMHQYITKHSDWLLEQLGAAEHLPLIGDKTISVTSVSLLYTMFFIGRKPFDQFLNGSWMFDWTSLLNTPLSLTAERAWTHIARRPEFQPDASLSLPDAAMITAISAHIKDLM